MKTEKKIEWQVQLYASYLKPGCYSSNQIEERYFDTGIHADNEADAKINFAIYKNANPRYKCRLVCVTTIIEEAETTEHEEEKA